MTEPDTLRHYIVCLLNDVNTHSGTTMSFGKAVSNH
jgi:hypothetical protein